MFKNLSHHWYLDNQVFGNHNFFILNIFLNNKSNYNINAKLNIYTNKIINCDLYNIDLSSQYAKNNPEYEKYVINRENSDMKLRREIYFPNDSFFALYKYSANIYIRQENTLLIAGFNKYETMDFELYNGKKNIYKFTISQSNNLLQ